MNTLLAFRVLGIHTSVAYIPLFTPCGQVRITEDIQVRTHAIPAGIAKHSLTHAAAKRLCCSEIWAFCLLLDIVVDSAGAVEEILLKVRVQGKGH